MFCIAGVLLDILINHDLFISVLNNTARNYDVCDVVLVGFTGIFVK